MNAREEQKGWAPARAGGAAQTRQPYEPGQMDAIFQKQQPYRTGIHRWGLKKIDESIFKP